tara:strand:- start:169 stop:453 length:285 start_codon:yes stop_codon:yes gene_type:complete
MIKKESKYKVGDYVLIDKKFSTDVDKRGSMIQLSDPEIAVIEDVDYTSLGPSYKLALVEQKTFFFIKKEENLKICYWESDILSQYIPTIGDYDV